MINTGAFNYINVLDKTADATWIRQECLSNNLANATTPGYKREDVNFEGVFRRALGNRHFESLDDKVENIRTGRLKPRTFKDYNSVSYRLDGNNVDPDTENVMLASNQIKYQAIVAGINQEFANIKAVIK